VDTYIYSSTIAIEIRVLIGHYIGFWQATFVLYMIHLSYNFWFLMCQKWCSYLVNLFIYRYNWCSYTLLHMLLLFAHESNMSRKLLFKTGKIGPSYLANRTIQFCWFRRQSGAPSTLDEGPSPSTKRHLIGGGAWATVTQGVEAMNSRSNRWKRKGNKSWGKSMKKSKFDWLCWH
jgi:hypothetical protein